MANRLQDGELSQTRTGNTLILIIKFGNFECNFLSILDIPRKINTAIGAFSNLANLLILDVFHVSFCFATDGTNLKLLYVRDFRNSLQDRILDEITSIGWRNHLQIKITNYKLQIAIIIKVLLMINVNVNLIYIISYVAYGYLCYLCVFEITCILDFVKLIWICEAILFYY